MTINEIPLEVAVQRPLPGRRRNPRPEDYTLHRDVLSLSFDGVVWALHKKTEQVNLPEGHIVVFVNGQTR